MDRDHGAAAAGLRIAIFPYQRNFLVEKLTELQRSLRLLLEALPKSTIWRAGLMREFPPASAGMELTAPFCLANRLAALRTERQRSLGLTPTHCVRCCPFCLANRLAALRTERQRSLTLTPAAPPTLSVLSSESPCGSSDRKATFAGAHSNSLRSLLSVLSGESPCGSSDRKATFTDAHSNSLRSLLSVLSCESPCGGICRNGMNTVAVCRDLW